MTKRDTRTSLDFERAVRSSLDTGAGRELFLKEGMAHELKEDVLPGIKAIAISINEYRLGFYSHRIRGGDDQTRCYINTLLSKNTELSKLPLATTRKIWVKSDALGQDFTDLSIQGATADEIAKVFPILRSIAQTAIRELETRPISELLRDSQFWYTKVPMRNDDRSAYG